MILLQQLGPEHKATVQVQNQLAELCLREPWIQVHAGVRARGEGGCGRMGDSEGLRNEREKGRREGESG
jgi:hypothetical protein